MANIKSQIKRIRTNEDQHKINKSYKSKVKTAFNKATLAITNQDENSQILITQYCSLIDKAVNKGIFHSNKAANKKAKIMLKYNKTLATKKVV